jgi:hypothetical protein
VLHYLVLGYRIQNPVALPPNQAQPEQPKKVTQQHRATYLHLVHD